MNINHKDIYGHISQNNKKLWALIVLFPIALSVFLYGILLLFKLMDTNLSWDAVNHLFLEIVPVVVMVCLIISGISFMCGSDMMLGFSDAKELSSDKKENLQIYRMVENIALTAGIPTPRVYVIDDDSLNAFATGYSPSNASIALTSGIIKKLQPLELQSVIAHEIGHILNRDIRLNMYIITGIGAIVLLGEWLLRSNLYVSNNKNDNKQNNLALVMMLIGLGLILFRYLIAPIIHMAISRTQEYQADTTSAYLTRNPMALVSALEKISIDPRVEVLDKSSQMAAVCIYNPLEKVSHLYDTHPSVENRIARLKSMI